MLELVPITLKEANAFVERYHRHHKPVVGHKFSIAASDGEKIVGVAIVGRPVSRYLDNGLTLEVNRLCTDGTRNACSFLYSAAWRAARNLGYKKLITYILVSETGSSLKAAGWKCVGECGGKRWNGRSAPKVDLYPAQMKLRFEVNLFKDTRWLLTLLINEALLAEDENAQLLEEKRVGRLIHAGNLQEVQNAIFKSFYRGTAGDNSDTENENNGEETTEEGNRAAVQEN